MTLPAQLVDIGDTRLEVFASQADDAGPTIATTHQYGQQSGSVGGWTAAFLDAGPVLVVNGRGSGGSDPEADPAKLTMRQTVEDLEALRQRLGLAPWVFAGTSTGGMLGLLYALRYPAALKGLIVNGTAASWRYITEPDCIYNPANADNAKVQAVMAPLYAPNPPPEARRRWAEVVLALSLHQKDKLPELLDGRGGIVFPRLAAFIEEVRPPDPYDLEARLGEIQTPTLVTCGRHDNQCPIRQSEILHHGLANSTFVAFEHSGHFPYVEEAAAFRTAVHQFIAHLN